MSLPPDHDQDDASITVELRNNVQAAVRLLGSGLLRDANDACLERSLAAGELDADVYQGALLRTVYRLMFLLVAEQRELLHPEDTLPSARELYRTTRSITHLARLSEYEAERYDLWAGVCEVFRALRHGDARLGLPSLGGLFSVPEPTIVAKGTLTNYTLVQVVRTLTQVTSGNAPAALEWKHISGETLGSVYEQLLELCPQVNVAERHFSLDNTAKSPTARRTSGSYYTPSELVDVVIQDALRRAIDDALAANPTGGADTLLQLTVVDPACGCGHFLLAAARFLALRLEPLLPDSSSDVSPRLRALRQVIPRCIYGVDLNATAIELCKVNLWLEMAEPGAPLSIFDAHFSQGNALLGAPPEAVSSGIPQQVWRRLRKTQGETLQRRHQANDTSPVRQPNTALSPAQEAVLSDVWCAAFFWPVDTPEAVEAAPTSDVWNDLVSAFGNTPEVTSSVQHASTLTVARQIARQHRFLHWHLRFPEVFTNGGFHVVLGNPPWIAHAGRAAQPLDAGVKQFYSLNYPAFAKYITTHGLFASVLPRLLRYGGYLGFILPSSLSELAGYGPTRKAHDALCSFVGELTDFGEGRFEGVTQPSMALITKRDAAGRTDAERGAPWPVGRPDLSSADKELLHYLASLPTLPPDTFAERGLQSDPALRAHFIATSEPRDRFTVPVREGTDVREFELRPARYHVDPRALGKRLRPAPEFEQVAVVVRQTARYPIAAVSDGLAFRNSLLAGLCPPGFSAHALVALLNSTLVRWHHFVRFRDARQPVLPQVKIAHLRAVPSPPVELSAFNEALTRLGKLLSEPHARRSEHRAELNDTVATAYGLTAAQAALLRRWPHA